MRGLDDILAGEPDDHGLPSFIYPLKKLIEEGHIVKLLLLSSHNISINVKLDWLKNEDIVDNIIVNDFSIHSRVDKLVHKVKATYKLYNDLVKELRTGNYDFVYCHGAATFLGNYLANRYGVRCGFRVYGTLYLFDEIKKYGVLRTCIKNPKDFLSYFARKEFILITDDGTFGNQVVNKMRLWKKYPIYFWKNGVEKEVNYSGIDFESLPLEDFIFTAGRINRVKSQNRVIDVLFALHKRGIKLSLYIAGNIATEDRGYYESLINQIQKYGLQKYVHFLGEISRVKMQAMASSAIATLLFSDCSNLGNVFFECAIAKSLIITYDEEDMWEYIISGENGYLVKDHKDAVDVVMKLLSMPDEELKDLKERLYRSVYDNLLGWDVRCEKEIALITSGRCD